MKGKSFELERVSVSLPKPMFEKLEEERGPVDRSKYIRATLKNWWDEGHTLEDLREVKDE